MKKIFLFVPVLFLGWVANCQKPIETDRPSQGESPSIVPRSWLQFEAGDQRDKIDEELFSWLVPTLLTRFGLTEKLELRLLTELNRLQDRKVSIDTVGLRPIELGFKQNLTEEKGLIPQTSLIVQVAFNRLASDPFKSRIFLSPNFRFAMQHSVSEKIKLSYNAGAEWEADETSPAWIYTFSPEFELGDKWLAFAEAYGFIRQGEMPDHNVDAGFAYNVSNNARLDLSAGKGISPESMKYFVALGFSFRLPTKKTKE
jgi:hypothetical protein